MLTDNLLITFFSALKCAWIHYAVFAALITALPGCAVKKQDPLLQVNNVASGLLLPGWTVLHVSPNCYPYNYKPDGHPGIEVLLQGPTRKRIMDVEAKKDTFIQEQANYTPKYLIWFMPLNFTGEQIDRSMYQRDGPSYYARFAGRSADFLIYLDPGEDLSGEFPKQLLVKKIKNAMNISE